MTGRFSKINLRLFKAYWISIFFFLIGLLASFTMFQWGIPLIGILLFALTSFYFLFLANHLLQQEIQEREKVIENMQERQQDLLKHHEVLEYVTKFTTSEPQNAVNEISQLTASAMQIERVGIWLYETENESPYLASIGLYRLSQNSFSTPPPFLSADYPRYFEILNTQSHLILPSKEDLKLNQELNPYMAFYGIQSKLDIPILFEGKLLGVLSCEEMKENRKWELEDRHFGQTIAGIIALLIELSTRRKAEKALQLSEERLRFVMQKAIDAVLSVTEQGTIVSWNYGAENMFGYLENEIMYQPLSHVIPIQIKQDEQSLKPLESKGRHKSGKIFPVEISHTRWQSGTLYFNTIIVRDITKRKEYEQKLIGAIQEAKAANQAKSEFLATISHELRTPLNSIIGFTQILLMEMDGPLNGAQRKNLEKVEKSSFHLLSLINDLLDIAKIEAHKMELEIHPGNITEVITSCLEEISSLINQKGLQLESSLEEALYLEMDSRRIRQVLLNLLSNAVKFTTAGYIKVQTINHPDAIEIQICDTGIGLSEEELNKIFQPFTQVDSSITRRFGGTGLGLAISKKIIELHHGSIIAISEKNKGSTFIVILPKIQP